MAYPIYPKPMKVRSANEIAKQIADLYEDAGSTAFQRRTEIIRHFEQVLNGIHPEAYQTPDRAMREIFYTASLKYADRAISICNQIQDFVRQKEVIKETYSYGPLAGEDCYIVSKRYDNILKTVTQEDYDEALKIGFSKDFFRNTFFSNIIFYCLPERADFTNSKLHECHLNVCAARGSVFHNTDIYRSEFNSVDAANADFTNASLANCQASYCNFTGSIWRESSLRHSRFAACIFDEADLMASSFSDTDIVLTQSAAGVRNLDAATFTFSDHTIERREERARTMRQELQKDG